MLVQVIYISFMSGNYTHHPLLKGSIAYVFAVTVWEMSNRFGFELKFVIK